ncbi:MAG: acyl-CoA dehydrogenase family protein [Henriciella sp.]|uniref:acyl-CoA dehydrogenase family protein n=1 Tax=Henriciella sp. TaxID=1968823 RepID=UPI003C7433E1
MPADAFQTTSTREDDLVARAARRIPLLKERAEEVEKTRALPQDLAETLARDGFYTLCHPVSQNGQGATPATYFNCIETLARGDASPAWCAFIATTASYGMSTVETEAMARLLERPDIITAGVFAPMGRAVPATENGEAGYRVTGRWAWGSSSQNASWIMGGCLVADETGAPVLNDKGKPRHISPVYSASDVSFIDTWTVSGLQGTGSTDFAVDNAFVPADRVIGNFDTARDDLAIYRFPGFSLLALGIAAVALGTARGAMEDFLELAHAGDGKSPLATKASSHRDAAVAEAAIRQGRAFLVEAVEACWAEAEAGPVSIERRRDLRLACTAAVRSAAGAVDDLYELCGGASVYRRLPIQRRFRDVHVATQHIMVRKGIYDLAGRLLLDQPTDVSML